LTKYNRQA